MAYRLNNLMPILMAGLLIVPSLTLVGCDDKGPAEKVGEQIDETVNDTKRAVEDAAD